jgi:hypothetical protein
MSKLLSEGDLVRIRRKHWWMGTGRLGVVLRRTYMAYDVKDSRWLVLIDDEVKEYRAANLFPA